MNVHSQFTIGKCKVSTDRVDKFSACVKGLYFCPLEHLSKKAEFHLLGNRVIEKHSRGEGLRDF